MIRTMSTPTRKTTGRHPPGRFRRDGFTFLELMLVLLVLGIIFSIGVVKMTGTLPRYRLRISARDIGMQIEDTRMVAISRGSWTGIRYHLDEDRCGYQILPPAPRDYPDEPVEEREPFERIFFEHPDTTRSVYPGVRIISVEMRGTNEAHTSGVVDVYFSPTGTEGSHIVRLAHRKGGVYSVTFNALTGTVDFFEQEDVVFEDFED